MEYVWYLIAGVIGGVLGGMGMGGGTILIPLLSIFYEVGQHTAQAVNLVAFIPMSIVAICIHLKNKLIKCNDFLIVVIPGLLSCVVGCYLARAIEGYLLKKIFGGFLVILAICQCVLTFISNKKRKNHKKNFLKGSIQTKKVML